MAYDDMRALHEQARQQADAFMARSREQMALAVQDQQNRFAGVQYGGGFAAGGGGGYPQAGTPAGRLLDTISDLTRKGAGVAGAPLGLAGAAAGQGFQFASAGGPFSTSGVWGGAATGAQRNMNFMQTLFTAYGEGVNLPMPIGNIGRWSAQRLDMEKHQAQTMARDELQYRLERGTEKAGWGMFDALSFGVASYQMRAHGMGLSHVYSTMFARNMQTQGRFITKDALREAGLGGYAGAFDTGLSHAGGRAFGADMAKELGFLEKEMGLAPEEVMALQNRAMGTMGITAVNEAIRRGGTKGLARETGRQTRAVREIQQTLHLDEKEAQEFFDAMGQMYGTAERIAGMTREAKQHAGQLGINVRQVFEYMRGFEDFGRTTGLGQTRAREMGMQYIGEMRQQQRIGAISREELMMYGGTTEEEALGIRAQTRLRQNIGLFRGGALGGYEVLAGAAPGLYGGAMGGRMGALETAGAIGGVAARDPFARVRGRYDPALEARMGQDAIRIQFERVQQESRQGYFNMAAEGADREALEIRRFETITNLEPLQAAREYRMFARETGVFGRLAEREDLKGQGRDIQNLYGEIRARGLLGYVTAATGRSSTYEGVANIYKMMGGKQGGAMTLDDALRAAGAAPTHATAAAREIGNKLAPIGNVLSSLSVGLTLGGATSRELKAWQRIAAGEGLENDPPVPENVMQFIDDTVRKGGVDPASKEGLRRRKIALINATVLRPMETMKTTTEFLKAFSGDISEATSAITMRGGDVNEYLLGVSGEMGVTLEDGRHAFVGLRPGSKASVRIAGEEGSKEVDLDALKSVVGNRAAARVYSVIARNMTGIEDRLKKGVETGRLGSETTAIYEAVQFGRYSDFARGIFGENVTDMRGLAGRLANIDTLNVKERARVVEALASRGMEGIGTGIGAAFAGTPQGLKLQDMGALVDLFGSDEEAAKAIRSAFGADTAKHWKESEIRDALQGKGKRVEELKAALGQNRVGMDLVDQLLKMGGVEYNVPKGRSSSDPIWVTGTVGFGTPGERRVTE
jgi:hypothetical protein